MSKSTLVATVLSVVVLLGIGTSVSYGQSTRSIPANTVSGKVVDIYTIRKQETVQESSVQAGAEATVTLAQESNSESQDSGLPPQAIDAASQDLPSGQPLPGLPPIEAWPVLENNRQDEAFESLPHALEQGRHIVAGSSGNYTINWVGLNNRAVRPAEHSEINRHVGQDRHATRPVSYAVRKPTTPPPVINTYLPAIHHIPVHIQVVPMGFDPYPYWYGTGGLPYYYGSPSVVPAQANPNYSSENRSPSEQPYFVRPYAPFSRLDQPVDTVTFAHPHYFVTQPTQRVYGVYIQPFTVTRRLP